MAKRKIVLVGCGAVGSSFIYSAINQGLAQEYVLIDAFEGIAEGNAIDFADCQAALDHPFISIIAGNKGKYFEEYNTCRNFIENGQYDELIKYMNEILKNQDLKVLLLLHLILLILWQLFIKKLHNLIIIKY